MRPTWDETFMFQAMVASTRSNCLIRHVGATLVLDKRVVATGYNGAPPNVETCLEKQVCFYQDLAYQDSLTGLGTYEVLKEQRKEFCSVIHAEKNVYNQCSLHGVSARGGILYCTNYPCPGCVRDVIIPNFTSEVVVWKDYIRQPLLTMDEYQLSKHWLVQAGVKLRKFDFPEKRIKEIFGMMLTTGLRTDYKFVPLTVAKTAAQK